MMDILTKHNIDNLLCNLIKNFTEIQLKYKKMVSDMYEK